MSNQTSPVASTLTQLIYLTSQIRTKEQAETRWLDSSSVPDFLFSLGRTNHISRMSFKRAGVSLRGFRLSNINHSTIAKYRRHRLLFNHSHNWIIRSGIALPHIPQLWIRSTGEINVRGSPLVVYDTDPSGGTSDVEVGRESEDPTSKAMWVVHPPSREDRCGQVKKGTIDCWSAWTLPCEAT